MRTLIFEYGLVYGMVWIGAFASADMEYTALVRGKNKAEALQIASTIKIID
jgi:hypothetical protein